LLIDDKQGGKTEKEKTMKRIVIIFLALTFVLAACGAPAPTTGQPTVTQAPPEPTQTAAVIVETVVEKVVETVVVTVIPTQAPTEVPSVTPLPPPTEVPPTQAAAAATQPPVQAAAPADTSSGLITVEDVLGAGWFAGMTRTRNDFALRCQLSKDITFSVKPADPNITQVQFYYRIEDRATGAVFDWQNAGKMLQDANGNFALVFSGDNVNANFRKPNAWFDYQFVGLSKSGGVVGRSEKIIQQVSYTFDCP
jgi:hypothetical protein